MTISVIADWCLLAMLVAVTVLLVGGAACVGILGLKEFVRELRK